MSIVHLIDTLTDWAKTNICSQIKLKVPPSNEAAVDAGYEYKLVTPAAFSMYIPTSDKLPPSIFSPFPSLCVGFVNGEDTPATGRGAVDVQLMFSTWDPGLHGEDWLIPTKYKEWKQWSGEDAENYFQRSGDGWRDAWNFVDIALRKLESTTNINGFVIDRASPIKFGPLNEQEAIPDLYATWFAWVSFRVTYPLTQRNIENIQDLL
ncbi:MAG: hypothetical protein J6A26_00190 [Oscillospiraceae bacterium]|nr:hypothetical protein [Oscillospiraceae bacterium]